MEKFIAIFIGGGLGALFRYLFAGAVQSRTESIFPWGTLAVNLLGCFIIGFLWTLFEYLPVSVTVRLFFITGILGGFTTFSSYGVETLNLARDGEFLHAAANILVSNLAGIALVFAGVIVSRILIGIMR
jgi:CrcB protein